MADPLGSNRTHEPSLRELTIDLDGVKELFSEKVAGLQKLADERDRRYEERFSSITTQTNSALQSSKEAVTKAENATEKRFDTVNEFRGTLSDQAASLLPRAEASTKFQAYDDRLGEMKDAIDKLRDNQNTSSGKEIAGDRSRAQSDWGIGLVVAIGVALLSAVISIVALFVRH
jgi:hypothetical protein